MDFAWVFHALKKRMLLPVPGILKIRKEKTSFTIKRVLPKYGGKYGFKCLYKNVILVRSATEFGIDCFGDMPL